MKTLDARLPAGIARRRVATATGLDVHYLECGAGTDRPLALLLHGFPELAFSWRKVMPALAEAGFHVVAPDQRGYGATTGADVSWTADLEATAAPALVRDALAFLDAIGRGRAEYLVGHDFGSVVAAWAALMRPDAFGRVMLMSAPFAGPPGWGPRRSLHDLDADLARLARPRRHYQLYFSEARANAEMTGAPGGVAAFIRAYSHMKSGDWAGNAPVPLPELSAEAMAGLPGYYVMARGASMPETVGPEAPAAPAAWLPDADLAVYAEAFGPGSSSNGFQGGLNWYRAQVDPAQAARLRLWAGARVAIPAAFVGGAKDWGIHQMPGALEAMAGGACADWRGTTLIEGAGHWVQQEAPEATARALLAFAQG
ncbi:MAG: alpha/beta fold hydrolase [Pseudomonadota bacterium]